KFWDIEDEDEDEFEYDFLAPKSAELRERNPRQRLEGVFRIASPLIEPIISMCAGVFRSRSSSRVCASVRRLSLTSVRIRCRRLSFSSEEPLVKSIFIELAVAKQRIQLGAEGVNQKQNEDPNLDSNKAVPQ